MSEPAARPSLRERLIEKLPEILIEAASVVLALLLALALNGWNEDRAMRARGDAARTAILAELRENRQEIQNAQPKQSHELSINLGISLLSEAAWRAGLATQASQTIDFSWMTRVAKVYELQESYQRAQGLAVDQLSSIPADPNLGGQQIARSLIPRMSALSQLADGLARSYDDVLEGAHP
jgi:hypothetical protein